MTKNSYTSLGRCFTFKYTDKHVKHSGFFLTKYLLYAITLLDFFARQNFHERLFWIMDTFGFVFLCAYLCYVILYSLFNYEINILLYTSYKYLHCVVSFFSWQNQAVQFPQSSVDYNQHEHPEYIHAIRQATDHHEPTHLTEPNAFELHDKTVCSCRRKPAR